MFFLFNWQIFLRWSLSLLIPKEERKALSQKCHEHLFFNEKINKANACLKVAMRTRGWLECCVYFRGNKKDTTTLTLYQYCYRISRPEVFLKVDLLKTLGKFPQKTLVMKYINNNVASIPLPIFFKVDLTTSVFLRVFQKFQDTYSVESLGATVSVDTLKHIQVINLVFSLMSSLHKKKSFLLVISSVNSKKEKETQQYSPSKETMFVA